MSEMRFVHISEVRSGMVTARPLYGQYGVLLLRERSKLMTSHVQALKNLGYPGIYIVDRLAEGVVPDLVVDEATRNTARQMLKEIFNGSRFTRSQKEKALFDAVHYLIADMVDQIFNNDKVIMNLPLLKSYDDYTYQHSVDVGVLAIILGKAMGMNKTRILDLGKAAFFHDMGKMFIPKKILNKPGSLTPEEFNVMKKHSELGCDFTREVMRQSDSINRAVLYHHERFEGGGYPHNLKGIRIPIFARIIAVSDVYDAITSKRVYRGAAMVIEGYEYVLSNASAHFDPEIVEVFAKTVAPFPVGITVRLSNEMKAVVMQNNPEHMMRPLVRMYDEQNPGASKVVDLACDFDALDVTILESC